MRIPRAPGDEFPGACPFHGDCLEGLASGTALEARGETDVELEARYLALGLVNAIMALSPRRVVLGGGVLKTPGLLDRVREEVERLVAGYVALPELVPPELGDSAGVVGAIELARRL